jgi:hypothetical protein
MKAIFITEEGKKAIEDKIAELKKPIAHYDGIYVSEAANAEVELLKEILSSATMLPVEESWEGVSRDMSPMVEVYYPNGVIII